MFHPKSLQDLISAGSTPALDAHEIHMGSSHQHMTVQRSVGKRARVHAHVHVCDPVFPKFLDSRISSSPYLVGSLVTEGAFLGEQCSKLLTVSDEFNEKEGWAL